MKRLHPELWDRLKKKWHQSEKGGAAGVWNARKAQLAVQEYKRESQRRFGDDGYRGPRGESLAKWTREDWGYVPGTDRYLPRAVREQLTAAERRREGKAKAGKLGRKVPYSPSVLAKMRAAGVLKPKK